MFERTTSTAVIDSRGRVDRRSFVRTIAAGTRVLPGSRGAIRSWLNRRAREARQGGDPPVDARRSVAVRNFRSQNQERRQRRSERHFDRRRRHPDLRVLPERRETNEGHLPHPHRDEQRRRPSEGDVSTPHRLSAERRHQAPDVRLADRQGTRPRRLRFAVVRQRPRSVGKPRLSAGQVRSFPSRRSIANARQRRSRRQGRTFRTPASAHERSRSILREVWVGVARREPPRSLRIGCTAGEESAT